MQLKITPPIDLSNQKTLLILKEIAHVMTAQRKKI